MGRESRRNRNKKSSIKERQEHQRGTEKQLRMSLMNMRQLFEGATQEKLQLAAQLDELKIMIAAAALSKNPGKGVLVLPQENLDRASLMDGIQVEPLDTGLGYSVTVVEAPPEEEVPEDAE